MRVYSPSQLTMHQFCGVARQLQNQGWQQKYMTALDIAKLVGSAVATGLDTWHKTQDKVLAWKEALAEYEGALQHSLDSGRMLGQTAFSADTAAKERLQRFLHLGIDQDPLVSSGWNITDTEYKFVRSGARADLIGYDPEGRLSVLDYKCMTEWPARKQRTKYFEQHFNGNQAMTYKFEAEYEKGIPIDRFYICLLTLEPQEIEVRGMSYDPRRYALWLDSAEVSWRRMEIEDELETPSTENASHENTWGPCQYQEACLYMARDPKLMQRSYVKVERYNRETI